MQSGKAENLRTIFDDADMEYLLRHFAMQRIRALTGAHDA
jgi:hypothetical protein